MNAVWLGRLLKGVHAGESGLLWSKVPAPETLVLTSPAFTSGGRIALEFAGKGVGDNVSPPLAWRGVPVHTAELVLVIEDPDAPLPWPFVHLSAYGILPTLTQLQRGELNTPGRALFGRNTNGSMGYTGPRALPAHGVHRYYFQLFALSSPSGLVGGARLSAVTERLQRDAIARGRLLGLFEREGGV
jgi:Raf kinase inhibitor-like YbhB/YbcL family protein